jgi:hypothetical protein
MKKPPFILGSLVLTFGLFAAAGCSPSSSDSTAKIDGMTPGEYREKAELSRQIAAPASKAQGRSKRP